MILDVFVSCYHKWFTLSALKLFKVGWFVKLEYSDDFNF